MRRRGNNHLNGSSVKLWNNSYPAYLICIKVWRIKSFKVRWESYVIINEIQSMIASIQNPFPFYSISPDYHHWPHFGIPFAKVSWVRYRDIHILTAGAYTYTSDQRFQALHRQNTGQNSEWSEWTLCIKWAQKRDQGLYECQISTIPVKSHQFYLNVVSKSPPSLYTANDHNF